MNKIVGKVQFFSWNKMNSCTWGKRVSKVDEENAAFKRRLVRYIFDTFADYFIKTDTFFGKTISDEYLMPNDEF